MKRLAFLAIVAAAAFIARAEGYQDFYTVEDFDYPPLTGIAFLQDNAGQDKTVPYTMRADKNGNYSLPTIGGGLPTVDSVFLTALNASLNAAKAYGEAMLAQAQVDRFAENLADLLYTTGIEITDADGTVKTLKFDAGALGLALKEKRENSQPISGTMTESFGDGTDRKSIEKIDDPSKAGRKMLQVKGFADAENTSQKFLETAGFAVPVKRNASAGIEWMWYSGWNPATFGLDGKAGEDRQLQFAGWDSPNCTASLNKMLSSADDSQNRRAHRIMARYQEGNEPPSLHYIPIDGIIQGGGNGTAPDGQSLELFIDGSSTNMTMKGFAGAGGASSSSSETAPKIPYVGGGALDWIDFGSMFGDAFAKPSDAAFGLSIRGLDEATGHQVLAADGSGSVFWRDVAEAEYTDGEGGERHTITFTKYEGGEAETKSVYLPRINVETDDNGVSTLKWLDLNDDSSTMHEVEIGGSSKIDDFYGDEEWSNFATYSLFLDYTDAEGGEQSIEATVPVNGFEITAFTPDDSATDKTTVTIEGTGTDGESALDLSFDVPKSQFDITALSLEVTGTEDTAVSIQAKLDYKDQSGAAQTHTAPLTIPANLAANYIPLVDEVSIWTNSASKKMEIKGFSSASACGESLSGLLTSTDQSQRESHEIICRYGSGDTSIHYLPIGDLLHTPDENDFNIDTSTGKFTIKPGSVGQVLKSGTDGVEWTDADGTMTGEGVVEVIEENGTKTIRLTEDAANNGKVVKTTNGSVGWAEAVEIEEGHPLEINSDGNLQFKVESQSQGKVLKIGADNLPEWGEAVASAGGFAYNDGNIGAGAFAVGRKFYRVGGVAATSGSWSLKVTIPADGGTPTGQIVGVDAFSQTPTETECWIPLFSLSNSEVVEDYRGAAMIPAYN